MGWVWKLQSNFPSSVIVSDFRVIGLRHRNQKLENDSGAWPDKNLADAPLVGIVNALEFSKASAGTFTPA